MWPLRRLLRYHPNVRRIELSHSGVICPKWLGVSCVRVATTVAMALAASIHTTVYKASAVLLRQETRREVVRCGVSNQSRASHPPTIVVIRRVIVRIDQGRISRHIASSVRENLVKAGSLGTIAVPRSNVGELRIRGPLVMLLPLRWVVRVHLRAGPEEVNFVAVEKLPRAPSARPDCIHTSKCLHTLVQPQTSLGVVRERGH